MHEQLNTSLVSIICERTCVSNNVHVTFALVMITDMTAECV